MYLTFSNLNSIHWIIKKDISLYVLFRTFQVNFQDISVTPKAIMKHKINFPCNHDFPDLFIVFLGVGLLSDTYGNYRINSIIKITAEKLATV